MDEKNTSYDVLNDNSKTQKIAKPAEENPQPLKGWDRFWERVSRLGLSNVALQVGSSLVTIALIGLIIWVMKSFFLGGEMTASSTTPLDFSGGGKARVACRFRLMQVPLRWKASRASWKPTPKKRKLPAMP
jgi:hypothetical protein